jgi:nitrate reductase NapE component
VMVCPLDSDAKPGVPVGLVVAGFLPWMRQIFPGTPGIRGHCR